MIHVDPFKVNAAHGAYLFQAAHKSHANMSSMCPCRGENEASVHFSITVNLHPWKELVKGHKFTLSTLSFQSQEQPNRNSLEGLWTTYNPLPLVK